MELEASDYRNHGYFHHYVKNQRAQGKLILQPRMGFSDFSTMRKGLEKVKAFLGARIGTITLDSYTRTGNFEDARRAVEAELTLNGYPIVAYSATKNRELIDGLQSLNFPIQVRHGSPLPLEIFQSIIAAGIDATEGGPISYCLPYSSVPLRRSITTWAQCCVTFSQLQKTGVTPHLETFGGCIMGQLCPPALLAAIAIIEGIFFYQHGLNSISLSYAQGSNSAQDIGAILALRSLAAKYLSGATWHVVVYTFMGMFPQTRIGSRLLIEESVRIAKLTNSERLVVKTASEAHQVPSIEENLTGLKWASRVKINPSEVLDERTKWHEEVTYEQARFLVDLVIDLSMSLDKSIAIAFERGYLDVPYCLHPNNKGLAKSGVDQEGNVYWVETGKIPFPGFLRDTIFERRNILTSGELLKMLSFNQKKYDQSSDLSTE